MVERNKSFQIAANVIMILLSVMCIVPFILLIMSSITKENILLKYGYSFWPREISFDAYKTLLVDSGSIVRGYIISALVTVCCLLYTSHPAQMHVRHWREQSADRKKVLWP